ncbi:MAG: exodeoxyribonuclease V subunit gamma, partial [Proteobacteria bacterium]|nr:exodeoxyribonuclease V subunit gamma [Pseudomonadota bacterium]
PFPGPWKDGEPLPALPFRLADRGLSETNRAAAALLAAMDLLETRFEVRSLLDVMALPAVAEHHELDGGSLEALAGVLARVHVHWGADAAHRGELDVPAGEHFSWRLGLDRLLVGLALDDDGDMLGVRAAAGPDVAECPPGEWVCVHDPKTYTVQVLCVVEGHFQADEICNELDDDCDGEVDETYFELGMPCDGPDTDECLNGAYECSEDGSGVSCGVESSTDLAESCDTIDNDCDGETDEHLTYEGIDLSEVCDGIGECGT